MKVSSAIREVMARHPEGLTAPALRDILLHRIPPEESIWAWRGYHASGKRPDTKVPLAQQQRTGASRLIHNALGTMRTNGSVVRIPNGTRHPINKLVGPTADVMGAAEGLLTVLEGGTIPDDEAVRAALHRLFLALRRVHPWNTEAST